MLRIVSPPVQLMDSVNKDDVPNDIKNDDVAAAPAKTPDLEAKAPLFDKE